MVDNLLEASEQYQLLPLIYAPLVLARTSYPPSGGTIMKAFIAAVICAVAIGVGASYVLHTQQETVDVAFSTSGARVGDPGHNLVGMN
jgi:hypothetical protein